MKRKQFIEKGNQICKKVKNEILANKKLAEKLDRMINEEEIEELRNIWVLEGLLKFDVCFEIFKNRDIFSVYFDLTKSREGERFGYGVYSEREYYEGYPKELQINEDDAELLLFLDDMVGLKDEILKAVERAVNAALEI